MKKLILLAPLLVFCVGCDKSCPNGKCVDNSQPGSFAQPTMGLVNFGVGVPVGTGTLGQSL